MNAFLGEIYTDYFMRDFSDALKEFQLINDINGREITLRNFIIGENSKILQDRNFNFFWHTCRYLTRVGRYSSIIKFMYGVFQCGKNYDLKKLKEKLDKVKIRDNETLSALCSDFYILMQKKSPLWEYEHKDEDISSFAPYNGQAQDHFSLGAYSPPVITKEIPAFIIKRILNIDIDTRNISKQDIDNIVAEIIKQRTFEFEEEEESIKKVNKKQEEAEEKYNTKLSRIAPKKITEFELKMEIPGILFDLFRAAELSDQKDICYYIQTEYLWPIMKLVPWKQENRIEVQLMAQLLGNYLDFIFSQELSRNGIYHLSSTTYYYNEKDFYEEMIGNKPGMLSAPGIEISKNYGKLGKLMSETIFNGKRVIKKAIPDHLYSFLMAMTSYLLYHGGNTEEAIVFLIRNYDEISLNDKRKLYIRLTLVKCILASKKIEEANILYGYYNYEMDRQTRERKSNLIIVEEIIRYIRDVRDYLELSHEFSLNSKKAWTDVVFGDGRILEDTGLAESYLMKQEIIPEALFKKLMLYVEAFSYPTGIRLKLLGLPNEDNYDKLPNALSDELIKQGQGLLKELDGCLTFYQSLNQSDMLKNINIFLQRHISKLMDNTIQDSMDRIKLLRKALLELKNSPSTNESDAAVSDGGMSEDEAYETDPETEEILKRIGEIITELTAKLESQYIGRGEVELAIDQLQIDFIRQYNLKIDRNNLIGLLPFDVQKDCKNFLITAEIVFRMLSGRKDRKQLDFSPALIPLTKALELVLNFVFHKMPFSASDMDYSSRSYYFDGNNNKKSIEFGPCINLLKDSMKIYVNLDRNDIFSWSNKHRFLNNGASRFEALNGDKVISFGRLGQFEGLSMLIQPKPKEQAVSVAFNKNQEHNRMLFIKALEYVKDNYRNVVAHKDGISIEEVEECRKILLQTENLLWILLYIINF